MIVYAPWTLSLADTAPVSWKERTYFTGVTPEGCWLCNLALQIIVKICDRGTIPHEMQGAQGICYTQHFYSLFWSPSADMCASSASFKQTLDTLHVLGYYLYSSLLLHNPWKFEHIDGTHLYKLGSIHNKLTEPETHLLQTHSRAHPNQILEFVVAHKFYPVWHFLHLLMCWLYPLVLPLIKRRCGISRKMCKKLL